MHQKNSPEVLKKAIHWLGQQDHDWSKHIQDRDTAVKMYLKSQKKETQSSSFQKDLQTFLSEETGAVLKNASKEILPPAKAVQQETEDLPAFSAGDYSESKSSFEGRAFLGELDQKSLQVLEKTKEEWNLTSSKEALRLLIQMGYSKLSKLKHF